MCRLRFETADKAGSLAFSTSELLSQKRRCYQRFHAHFRRVDFDTHTHLRCANGWRAGLFSSQSLRLASGSPQRVNDSSLGRFNFYRDLNALPVAPAHEQLPVGDTVRVDRFMFSASFSASQLSIVFTTFPDSIRGA